MFLDWEDDEATRNGKDSKALDAPPLMPPFNPRIRIIGIPPVGAPPATQRGPFHPPPGGPSFSPPLGPGFLAAPTPPSDELAQEGIKTRKMQAVAGPRSRRALPPPRCKTEPRLALAETSEALPLVDADMEVLVAQPSSSVSIAPIVSVGGPASDRPVPAAQDDEDPETLDPKHVDRASPTQIGFARLPARQRDDRDIAPETPRLVPLPVTTVPFAAPEAESLDKDDDVSHVRHVDDELPGLDWSDHENGTQPLVESVYAELPSDLQAALAHEAPPPDAPESSIGPISLPSWEDEEDLTMPQRFANLQRRARELALAYQQRHARTGDTLVEASPPSGVADIASNPGHEEDSVDAPLPEAFGPDAREHAADAEPVTHPSSPPASMLSGPPSVEIALSELETEHTAIMQDADELRAEAAIAPADVAPPVARAEMALHDARPSSFPSIMPVAISEPPPAPPRKGRGARIAAGVVALAACAAAVVAFIMPRDGSLEVRLRTADGSAASRAEIYVDGQKRCDTDPCVVSGLSGQANVKVIVPGLEDPQVATATVTAGERQTLWIDLPSRQSLRVGSKQRDVRVSVDGKARGVLPIEIADLPAGEHTIAFDADGHAPLSRKIDLTAGKQLDLGDIALSPLAPELTIDLATEGARVVLLQHGGSRQVLTGPWPMKLTLSPGRYQIVASARGHAVFEHEVVVKQGQAVGRVDIALEPARRRAKAAPDSAEPVDFDPYAGLDE